MNIHFTRYSKNRKLGPIAATIAPRETCPPSCPWKDNGCYFDQGHMRAIWNAVGAGRIGQGWKAFMAQLKRMAPGLLWRYGQGGDLPGKGERINRRMLAEMVTAQKGLRGWAYTHKKVLGRSKLARLNRAAIKAANKAGFAINLSADNLVQADQKAALNIGPVAAIVPYNHHGSTKTPAGRPCFQCPATIHVEGREDITCAGCGLCADPLRKSIVLFPAHGSFKRRISEMVTKLKQLKRKVSHAADN